MNSNNPFFKTKSFKENNDVTHDAVIIDYNQTMTVTAALAINKINIRKLLLIVPETVIV